MIPSINKAASDLRDTLNTQLPSGSYKYRIKAFDTLQSIVTTQFNLKGTGPLSIFERDKIISIILADPRNHLKSNVNLPVGHVLYIPKRMQI